MRDVVLPDGTVIPDQELTERFETSGGPGGQHANRSATRVVLEFDLAVSEVFDEALKRRMLDRLGGKALNGRVTVSAGESRSQWRNRAVARRRLAEMLAQAMRRPPTRRPTTPSRAANRRRLAAKRARSETKHFRRRPGADD